MTITGLVPLLLLAQGDSRNTITTFAGSSLVGDGGPASAALLLQPEGIAVDAAGNIYVSDAADHRIRKIGVNGTIQTLAGTGTAGNSGDNGPAREARLNTPYGVAVDRLGNVYVADLSNARVRRIRADGTITTAAGGGKTVPQAGAALNASEAKLDSPRNVAVDAEGNLYVSDFGGQRIYRVTSSGLMSIVAGIGSAGFEGDGGMATQAKLAYPAGLCIDRNGALYFADSGNKRIRKVFNGMISTVPNLTLDTPTGVATDPQNVLYIADGRDVSTVVTPGGQIATLPLGGRDIAFDQSGTALTITKRSVWRMTGKGPALVAGSLAGLASGDGQPAQSARLNGPIGLARDPGGAILIGDAHNRRVRIVDANSIIRTLVDGLDYAPYIAIDSRGIVYISETNAHRIRRVIPGGAVLVFAGTGDAGAGGDGWQANNAQLSSPTAIAIDAADGVYVADTGNHVVRKILPDSRIIRIAGGGNSEADGTALSVKLAAPAGVAVDKQGNVYLSEADGGRVRKLSPDGMLKTIAKNLSEPRGLRVAENGDIFVAETGGNRIRRITPAGEITIVAGTGAAGFEGDGGPGGEAVLNGPIDLVLDGNGAIWFSDTGNNRVRRITASPAAPAPVPEPAKPIPPVPTPVPPAPTPEPPKPIPPAPIEAPKVQELAVLHGATMQPQAVAIGQFVSIFGDDLGPADGIGGRMKSSGVLETDLGGTQVLFDGSPAPLYYAQARQINAQVPNSAFGSQEVEVTVNRDGKLRGRGKVRLRASAPGILTRQAGSGLAAALNEDGATNSVDAPAQRGRIVTLFATGDGALGFEDGRPAEAIRTLKTVYVHIEGQPAEILYAGRAPGLVGLMQLNVRIPANLPLVGGVRVVLHIDGEVSQSGVIVQVK